MDKRAAIPVSVPHPTPTLSYWHSDTPLSQERPNPQFPSSKLEAGIGSLRSTEDLPEYADYLIVGSGISGAMIAWNILERLEKEGRKAGKGEGGVKVVMLEAREAVGGASGRNGGHTTAASYRSYPLHASSHSPEEASKIAHLELSNINATHSFASTHCIPCESRPCSTVDIIHDQRTFDSGVSAISLMKQQMGEEDEAARYEIFDKEYAAREFLAPGEDVVGAFKYAAGSINAFKFTRGVLNLCLDRGLNLQTFTPVESISKSFLNNEGGPTWSCKTPRGEIRTLNLILATNAYTAHLLSQMQGKVVPLRGQVTAHRPGARLKEIYPKSLPTTYSFIYADGYDYMIPRPHIPSVPVPLAGDIIIGGGLGQLPNEGLSEYGETDDSVLNPENSKYLRDSTKRYFGENWGDDNEGERVRMEWTGIMGITGDGVPYVGAVPGMEGVWVSAGFNGHGMVLCLKCAEALTHMVFSDAQREFEWFPESYRITNTRLEKTVFEGRKNMKAPPEIVSAAAGT